ncbi:MAG: hypothetical protein AAF961_14890, partial [Planctomycetota bacterium]
MNRRIRPHISVALCGLVVFSGCQPTQPFYFGGDEDLSHYVGVATEIDYPDVCHPTLEEVETTRPPLTLDNFQEYDFWNMTLEEITRIALQNSQVLRTLGGRVSDGGQNISATSPETLAVNAGQAVTAYDAAI